MLTRLLLIVARRLFRNWLKHASPEVRRDAKSEKFVADIMRIAAIERLPVIERKVIAESGSVVQAGPFKDMKLSTQTSWGDGAVTQKLLGCYEQELADYLIRLKDRSFDCVINVGSAEGYYTVGAAMILDTPRVIAVDIDPNALEATARNAATNGVADKVVCQGALDGGGLAGILADNPDSLVISDCEGFELDLFNNAAIAAMGRAACLIECHDFVGKPITDELVRRLAPSHEVEVISEGPRNPNAHEVLRGMDNLDRWLAMCEFRPETMRWIFALPKASNSEAIDD